MSAFATPSARKGWPGCPPISSLFWSRPAGFCSSRWSTWTYLGCCVRARRDARTNAGFRRL